MTGDPRTDVDGWEAQIDAWKAEMESLTIAELIALDLTGQHTTDEEGQGR